MRGALFWTASTLVAFAVTAGVFLTLAELGTSPPGQSLGNDSEQDDGSDNLLSVEVGQNALESLEESEDQTLDMTLRNNAERELTDINVYLILYSEDTADQQIRYYETPGLELDSMESKPVSFDGLDLSPPETGDQPERSEEAASNSEARDRESFNILEIRAASSEGASTVKTAVLAF